MKKFTFNEDSGHTYTTTQHDDGHLTCDCPGFGSKKTAAGRPTCRHTRQVEMKSGVTATYTPPAGWQSFNLKKEPDSLALKAAQEIIATGTKPFILPQLLTPITVDDAEKYLTSDTWYAQEKLDGKRILLDVKRHSMVLAYNRKGKQCISSDEIETTAVNLNHSCVLDGEMVKGVFYAFDCLFFDGTDIRGKSYASRYQTLESLITNIHPLNTKCAIRLVPLAVGTMSKTALFKKLQAEKREGIVFKKRDAPYTSDRGPDQIKCKFYATASCVVIDHSSKMSKSTGEKKSSVSLGLYPTKKKTSKLVPVGNCTIPQAMKLPPVGSIVEVRYLYAYKGGSLYQPNFLFIRDDSDADCLADLKYKPDSDEAEVETDDTPVPDAPVGPVVRRRVILD